MDIGALETFISFALHFYYDQAFRGNLNLTIRLINVDVDDWFLNLYQTSIKPVLNRHQISIRSITGNRHLDMF